MSVAEIRASSGECGINASSIFWILLGGGAAVIIAIRTIKYNKARDREYEAYKKALQMLKAEFSNLDLIAKMQHHMTNSQIPSEAFETTAWRAVLTDSLLGQMHEEDSKRLTDIYRLIEEAEKYRSQLIELTGQQSSLEGSAQLRRQYQTSLTRTLDELGPDCKNV